MTNWQRYLTMKTLLIIGAIGLFFLILVSSRDATEVIDTTQADTEARLTPLEELTGSTTVADTTTSEETPADSRTESVLDQSVSPVANTDVELAPVQPEPEPAITQAPPIPPTPSPSLTGFSSSAMLAGHNGPRAAVGVSPLTWSTTLAASAQSWADALQAQDCGGGHDFNTPYGENIYWQWGSGGGSGLISSPADATRWWAAEADDYDYNSNQCASGETCSHYTQLVWAKTTAVGCGVSSCVESDRQTDVWVCRYDPAGNDGTRPY